MKTPGFAPVWFLLFSAVLVLLPTTSPAANHYILPSPGGASGTSGSDWNNACSDFTGKCAPGSMVRGDTYYVAGSTTAYTGPAAATFNVANSGTSVITILRATAANSGTVAGWSSSYDQQVHITCCLSFDSSYWVLDGVVGTNWSTTSSSYGIAIDAAGCGSESDAFWLGLSSSGASYTNFTFNHIYAQACSTDVAKYFVLSGYQVGAVNNVTVGHSWLDGWQNGMHARGQGGAACTNWIFEYNLATNGYSSSANHGEWLNPDDAPFSGLIARYNVFRGYSGSAGQTGTIVANNSDNNGAQIYGNVFDTLRVGNGVITGTSDGNLNNAVIYNNTFLNMTSDSGNALCGTGQGSGNVAYNNVFYNTSAQVGGGCTTDYDAYFSTTNTPKETHGQTGSGNPFVNSSSYNYQLKSDTSTGTTLSGSSPTGCTVGANCYNIDPLGVTRGDPAVWDRGAYQLAAAGIVAPPTNLTAVVH